MNEALDLLHVGEILNEETDEDHIITSQTILSILKNKYNTEIEIRKLYRIIDILQEYGIPISDYNENHKGYYLKRDPLRKAAIFDMCHAIHSTMCPDDIQKEVEQTMLAQLSRHQRKEYTSMVIQHNDRYSGTNDWLHNYGIISTAASIRHKISFHYCHCNENLEYVPDEKEIIAIPAYQLNDGMTPYLASYIEEKQAFYHYRIDRMSNVKITDEEYYEHFGYQDAYDYSKNKPNMFAGNARLIKLLCKKQNHILDHIRDELGKNVTISNYDDEYYLVTTWSTISGIIIFAQKYLDLVRIISPDDVVKIMKKNCEELMKFYREP